MVPDPSYHIMSFSMTILVLWEITLHIPCVIFVSSFFGRISEPLWV